MSLFAAPSKTGTRGDAYDRKKDRTIAKNRKATRKAQDIGALPPIENPDRRASAEGSFRAFLDTYFPHRFPLPWSGDHIEYIADIQRAVLEGGLQATALPRGSGKTTIAECAMIWGALTGRVPFGVLLGATKPASFELLDSIRTEFETNELLLADFPEACYPIRKLEGTNQKRMFFEGKPVRCKVMKEMILLPNLPGAKSAGAIIRTAGLTGRVRGMKYTRTDGSIVRPSFVIPDDPQTDKSARSDNAVAKLDRLIRGAVLGLAGPGKAIAAVMPCTIIRRGDLADSYLDRQKNPDWHGRKSGLLKSMPTDMELWQQYWEIRANGLRAGDGGKAGNVFYKKHRTAMDAGAVANWPERYKPDELSAIQHFMNLYLTDRLAALAEYQNDPEDETKAAGEQLEPDVIIHRTNGHKRGVLPTAVEYFSVGIDVQKPLLYWSGVGSEVKPTSYVADYGTWPKQRTNLFDLRDASRTIQKAFPDADLPGQLYSALETLTAELIGREWVRSDGNRVRLGRIVIDARWQPDTVFKFCRQSPHRDILVPAMGVRTSQLYMDKKPSGGQKHGSTGDYKLQPAGAKPVRYLILDSSRWISRVVSMLRVPVGSTGAMTFFEAPPEHLRMISEHLCAEYAMVLTEKETHREIVQWQMRPGKTENHLLDATKLAVLGNYEQGTRESIDAPKSPGRHKGGGWADL